MSHPKLFRSALLACGLLLGAGALANESFPESSTPATNKTAFNATLRGGETVGDHQVQRAFLNLGTNSLAFIVPNGFRMDASSGDKIVLSDNSGTYFITVKVTGSASLEATPEVSFFQERALIRFPGGKISKAFSAAAAHHSGPAFDLSWSNASGAQQSARIAFVPCPAGILEFSILCRTANFGDAQRYLTVLMASVRSNETGKLVITPLPTNS